MPVPPNYADLDIYFQCRIPDCQARCQRSPKDSGRLGDHWKLKHVDEHGLFKGREVLVKTRNANGTFSTTTFDAYAIANGINYKTQDTPRPTRHAKSSITTSSSTAQRCQPPRAPMEIKFSPLACSSITSSSATAQPTSNLRRVARMERQLRVASMPAHRLQPMASDPETLDSHPVKSLPHRSSSTRLPLKRNLSKAFHEAKSSTCKGEIGTTKINAQSSFDFPSAPTPPKITFSQMLISHLVPAKAEPAPVVRTALNATQALRGTIYLPSHIGDGAKKDYSRHTWSCEMCHIDFPNMATVTVHLRDHHAVESDVVTLTPDRDVITMVLASVKIDVEERGWVDENGDSIKETKRSKQSRRAASDADDTEMDEEIHME